MIVHRLDMDTSGLVIFTRTDKVLRWIHGSLQDREGTKLYEALLDGHFGQPGEGAGEKFEDDDNHPVV